MFFILNILNNAKYLIIAGVVALLLLTYGCVKCSHRAQDKARIKHNNNKLDEFVDEKVDRADRYDNKNQSDFLGTKKSKKIKIRKLSPEEIKKARDREFDKLEGTL